MAVSWRGPSCARTRVGPARPPSYETNHIMANKWCPLQWLPHQTPAPHTKPLPPHQTPASAPNPWPCTPSSEADEIRCAREHVERAHGCRVVGLLGHSKGATDAIVFAGKYRGIPRVVNLAGRFDVSGGVERRLGTAVLRQLEEEGQVAMRGRSRARGEFTWLLTKGDLTDRLTTDVAAACAAIPADTRVLTVHGTDDADVPLPEAHKFAAAIRSHELLVVEGGDHTFSAMGALLQLVPPVVAFLKEGAA